MGKRGPEAHPRQVAEPDVGALGLDQILSLLCKAGPGETCPQGRAFPQGAHRHSQWKGNNIAAQASLGALLPESE